MVGSGPTVDRVLRKGWGVEVLSFTSGFSRKLRIRINVEPDGGRLDGLRWPALETAGLDYRAPYNLRHAFAYWSLRAGVPIASVAREMGHGSTEHTFRVYGGWCLEVGASAAQMRAAWAADRAKRRRASDLRGVYPVPIR